MAQSPTVSSPFPSERMRLQLDFGPAASCSPSAVIALHTIILAGAIGSGLCLRTRTGLGSRENPQFVKFA